MREALAQFHEAVADLSAGDVHYRDYLRDGPPEDQIPPTERQLDWLRGIAARDANFASMSATEQAQYLECVSRIERSTSFLSQSGATLEAPKRLFLAFHMARSLLRQDPTVVEAISSVVAYGGSTKIRKGHPEAGFVTIEAPLVLCRVLLFVESATSSLVDSMRIASKSAPELVPVSKRLEKWRQLISKVIGRLTRLADLPRNDLSTFLEDLDAQQQLLVPHRSAVGDSFDDIHRVFGGVNDILRDHTKRVLETHPHSIKVRRASIHVSWTSFMSGFSTEESDLMSHELAHFSHSFFDVGHYITHDLPRPQLRSAFATELENLFGRFIAGEFGFLRDYGKRNVSEFFAVSSEHFFTGGPTMKLKAPELFVFLAKLYGYEPVASSRESQWWLLKHLFGPLSVVRHA